jgi:hypothetical protein
MVGQRHLNEDILIEIRGHRVVSSRGLRLIGARAAPA